MMTRKLFAVVALVGGCELADAEQQQGKPAAPVVAPAPAVTAAPSPAPAMAQPTPAPVSVGRPRTLPNGRPACGNVASRMANPCPPEPTK